MDQHLIFLLLGLANGAVFASLAMALVVTYRSSGVLNFATGTIALYGVYTYAFLRQGQLLVLIPGLPEKVDLGSDLSFWPATLLTLAHHRGARSAALPDRVPAVARGPGGGQGGGVDRGHGRHDRAHVAATRDRPRVRRRDPADEGLDPRHRPDLERPRRGSPPRSSASRSRSRLPSDSPASDSTPAPRPKPRRERSSAASRPIGSPPLNWMISAAVAAIAGILIAPIVPLVPISYTLFIVPALAAAVLGRFQYVIPAVLGGLFIGMLQSEVTYFRSQHGWLPSSGLPELIPLDPDPPGARRASQAAPESRGHPAAHARAGAAPAAHPRADGAGNRRRRARADPVAPQLARRDGDELHLRDHLPVPRRRDRLRRAGVAGTTHPGGRRRIPARDHDDGVVDPVPDRADPRCARRNGRRRDRRSPGDPRPWTLRRRGDARDGVRRAGGVVPQLRLRAGRRQGHQRTEVLRARSPLPRRHRLSPARVLPGRARRAGDRRGVRRVAATQPARLRHARGPRERAVRRRCRHQRRTREDPGVRHRRVHRRARRRTCSATSRATSRSTRSTS